MSPKSYRQMRAELLGLLGETQASQGEAIGLPQGRISQLRRVDGPAPRSKIERLLLCALDSLEPKVRRKAVIEAVKRMVALNATAS